MMTVSGFVGSLDRPEAPEKVAADSLYALGYQYFEAGRFGDAIKLFRVVMQVLPEDERGWLGTAACHESLGQLEVAANLYAAAMVATDRSVRCALACHRVFRELGRTEESEAALEKAWEWAEEQGDERLIALVGRIRGRRS